MNTTIVNRIRTRLFGLIAAAIVAAAVLSVPMFTEGMFDVNVEAPAVADGSEWGTGGG